METWLTVEQAAALSGYHPNYIRQLVRAGTIQGRKFGPVWQIHRQALLDYIASGQASGDGRRGPK